MRPFSVCANSSCFRLELTPSLLSKPGGTNYKGQMVFANQGRGADIPANLAVVNPYPPYNSTIILNNFFGRQVSPLLSLRCYGS